jgi:hypothetical protein
MKTLLRIAVALFIGYIVIEGLVKNSQHETNSRVALGPLNCSLTEHFRQHVHL